MFTAPRHTVSQLTINIPHNLFVTEKNVNLCLKPLPKGQYMVLYDFNMVLFLNLKVNHLFLFGVYQAFT